MRVEVLPAGPGLKNRRHECRRQVDVVMTLPTQVRGVATSSCDCCTAGKSSPFDFAIRPPAVPHLWSLNVFFQKKEIISTPHCEIIAVLLLWPNIDPQ